MAESTNNFSDNLYNTHHLEELFSAGSGMTLFVWENTEAWPVRFVSNNVSSLLGYSVDEFLQQQVAFADLVHPDDIARVKAEVELLNSGKTGNKLTHQDYRLRHRQGHYLWVSDTTVSRFDKTAGKYLLIGYLLDVTNRKQLELNIETERNRLSLLLDATRVGTWEWNPQTHETIFNRRWAEIFGYSLDEIEQHVDSWSQRIHPDDRVRVWEAVDEHLAGQTAFYQSEYRMRHRNGRWVYVLDRGRIIERDNSGKALRYAGTISDVTEQKQAEFDALRAAHAKNVFLANMSHEIRTPLHGILGLASVLESTDISDYQQTLLSTIKTSGDYLLNTLNDLLDLTRAEEGQLKVKLGTHRIADVLEHIHSIFSQRIAEKGLQFSIDVADDLPEQVVMDNSRVIQIISNLISNAIKFTQQGYIKLTARWRADSRHKGELELVVEDSGSGIKDTQRIWQLFEQEDTSLTKSTQGSGLGLAIVRSLVMLLNGTIRVDSQPNEGSRFTLCLPMAVHRGVVTQSESAIAASDLPVKRLLVVDDNPINQLIVKEMLKSLGQQVAVVNNGEEAITSLKENHFDGIFLDLHMPKMDGMETARTIRADAQVKQPFIIALTANAFNNTRQDALAAGMDEYITKPFVKQDLAKVLQLMNEVS